MFCDNIVPNGDGEVILGEVRSAVPVHVAAGFLHYPGEKM